MLVIIHVNEAFLKKIRNVPVRKQNKTLNTL